MLEPRVARLEEIIGETRADLREMRGDIREVRGEVRSIREHIGRIEERLARIEAGFEAIHHRLNSLPTVWTFTVALLAGIIGAAGLAFTMARVLGP